MPEIWVVREGVFESFQEPLPVGCRVFLRRNRSASGTMARGEVFLVLEARGWKRSFVSKVQTSRIFGELFSRLTAGPASSPTLSHYSTF